MDAEAVAGEVTIVNDLGLHTRAATVLVKLAKTFSSDIEISWEGLNANAKSIMGLLALGARKGAVLRLSAKGSDQEQAFHAIRSLVEGGFQEVPL
jgi:phosphotransferase system HPr (HPr) family protein